MSYKKDLSWKNDFLIKGLTREVSNIEVFSEASKADKLNDIDLKKMAEWILYCLEKSPREKHEYETVSTMCTFKISTCT
jgi:hypothetical protein